MNWWLSLQLTFFGLEFVTLVQCTLVVLLAIVMALASKNALFNLEKLDGSEFRCCVGAGAGGAELARRGMRVGVQGKGRVYAEACPRAQWLVRRRTLHAWWKGVLGARCLHVLRSSG